MANTCNSNYIAHTVIDYFTLYFMEKGEILPNPLYKIVYICATSLAILRMKTHNESSDVSFQSHIGQIRHHVGNHLEPSIFCQLEGLTHCMHCVTSIGVPGNIFIHTLDSNFKPSTTIGQHLTTNIHMTIGFRYTSQ